MDISGISSVAAGSAIDYAPSSSMRGVGLHKGQTPAEQRKVVASQFEAIMLRQMLSQSVGAMMGGEDSPTGSTYGYMLTDAFAQKLSQGGGMGLGKIIERQLTPAGETP